MLYTLMNAIGSHYIDTKSKEEKYLQVPQFVMFLLLKIFITQKAIKISYENIS